MRGEGVLRWVRGKRCKAFWREIRSDCCMIYDMGLLVIDVHHFVAEFAFADVSAAVGLVQIDDIWRKHFVAILANRHLFFFHF